MTVFSGRVTTLGEHFHAARDVRHRPVPAIRLWPRTEAVADAFVSCSIDDVLLTSFFVPIDLGRSLLYLDQSYSGLVGLLPVRFKVVDGAYHLDSEPIVSPGRHVVIGGPVDTVWYHWLFNWCPRMLLVKQLRPDLFAAPDVRFVVHPNTMLEPYRAVLDTFGLAEDRFLVIDPARDYRLEEACLVSFPDQNKLYPDLIQHFSRHLLDAFGTAREPATDGAERGVFASRQALPPPKRRIANFEVIEPVLHRFDLKIASLGAMSARQQARLFHRAKIVVGAHGSDLSNILFCKPGTPVVVIENRFSVAHNLHIGLLKLAEVLDLDYHLLLSDTTDERTNGLSTIEYIARDYIVDPDQLAALLASLSGPLRYWRWRLGGGRRSRARRRDGNARYIAP